ncbi:MAG: hypothetical protein B6242_02325 [Anaerolineaceae bacterium 4572_78]|nr:MAG: hypothetical protein B6242_02325 [Anaerolineaceae bacterium 4572_78]
MAYSKFTLEKVQKDFQLGFQEDLSLFVDTPIKKISGFLQQTLQENISLATAIDTEKVRSELIVAPILVELRKISHKNISFFSGIKFNVDSSKELDGFCDFLISRSKNQLSLQTPIVSVVEAKNDNIKSGYGQCISMMIASRIFNEREKNTIETMHGVVTTGTVWKFLKLIDNVVYVDHDEYHINQVEKIMGILVSVCE